MPFVCEAAEPKVVGWCLERHDLWVSKAAAGRDKDSEFCRAMAEADLVYRDECSSRIERLDGSHRRRALTIASTAFASRS